MQICERWSSRWPLRTRQLRPQIEGWVALAARSADGAGFGDNLDGDVCPV